MADRSLSTLLGLPAELRFLIYDHCYNFGQLIVARHKNECPFEYNMLHVNRFLRDEAFNYILSRNQWVELALEQRIKYVMASKGDDVLQVDKQARPSTAQLLGQCLQAASLSKPWIQKLRQHTIMQVHVAISRVELTREQLRRDFAGFSHEYGFMPYSLIGFFSMCEQISFQHQPDVIVHFRQNQRAAALADVASYLAPFGLVRDAASVMIKGLEFAQKNFYTRLEDHMESSLNSLSEYRSLMLAYEEIADHCLSLLPSDGFEERYKNNLKCTFHYVSEALDWAKEYQKQAARFGWKTTDTKAHFGAMSIVTDVLNKYASTVVKLLYYYETRPGMDTETAKLVYCEIYNTTNALRSHQYIGMTHEQRAAIHSHLSIALDHHAWFVAEPERKKIALRWQRKNARGSLVPEELDLLKQSIQHAKLATVAHQETAAKMLNLDKVHTLEHERFPAGVEIDQGVIHLSNGKGEWRGARTWITRNFPIDEAEWCIPESQKDYCESTEEQMRDFEKEMGLPMQFFKTRTAKVMMRLLGPDLYEKLLH